MQPGEPSANALTALDEAGAAQGAYRMRLRALIETHRAELGAIVRHAFAAQRGAEAAVDLLPALSEDERKALLPMMLGLCSSGRWAHVAKPFILALPHAWLRAAIEAAAEPMLAANDLLDWCNLLDVFERLDPALANRFATRMAAHPNGDIAEWGRDFLAARAG